MEPKSNGWHLCERMEECVYRHIYGYSDTVEAQGGRLCESGGEVKMIHLKA